MKIKRLAVFTAQNLAGSLTRESQFVFNYMTKDSDQEVSLLMPLREQSYSKNTLPGVFRQNLPEGYLLDVIRRKLARDVDLDDMQLLRLTGERQIGRLIFRDPENPLKIAQSGLTLAQLIAQGNKENLFEILVSEYLDAGISGMQPKVMIEEASDERATLVLPGLIVKTAGSDYPDLVANEFLCMEAARKAGIQVPEFWISDDHQLFVMRRFDRVDGRHLGFEDMAVLSNQQYDVSGNYKYRGSYEAIARLITAFSGDADDSSKFFEYVALSCMVRNGDAHLKNFGMLYETPAALSSVRLAPLYDVVTTTIYPSYDPVLDRFNKDPTLALKLGGKKTYPDLDALITFGREHCGVIDPVAVIKRLGKAMQSTLDEHGPQFPDQLMGPLKQAWQYGLVTYDAEPDPEEDETCSP